MVVVRPEGERETCTYVPDEYRRVPQPLEPVTSVGTIFQKALKPTQLMRIPDDSSPTSRRAFLGTLCAAAGLAAASRLSAQPARAAAPLRDIVVYKDPGCGCCKAWVTHLQGAGFKTTVRDTAEMTTVKASFGVPAALESCHTARIGRYTIEGHVPADLIAKLVAEQPAARGLAVPGMPVGSPGMEGSPKQRYDVLLFDAAGKTRVYASR